MSKVDLPYQLFDADNHLYETKEALTRHLPKEYEGAIQYVEINGRTKIAVLGQISEYIPNPTFEVVARPGAMEEYFKHGNPEGKSRREIFGKSMKAIEAFRNPEARLKVMDDLQLQRALMFPTLASLVEERMRHHPELIHAVIESLNRWMLDDWGQDGGFVHSGRIFTVPVITLPIVERAIAELNWAVVEHGAKAILVRPAPVPGFKGMRSFALPEFDPFWKRVVELDVLVTMHSSDSGYSRFDAEWDGNSLEMLPFQTNTFAMTNQWRPVTDAVASWVCHGALNRFPELKIAVIENGSAWLEPLLQQLSDVYKKAPEGFGFRDPIEAIKQSLYVSPFWEEDLQRLSEVMGADHVLFGSDWPHPEGLAEPARYIHEIKDMPLENQAKIMGGNLARLLKV
ncbi:amidohydrolase family protein [Nocardia implantans]|uniref:Amidohydrolase family protein n=1 Tax=Nocardia implantans TaxID=3108168 RepID=A0ABU6AVF7_9NOCA|nr:MULTISPECIES: amidohydrolase family protein [unclassified Nocardia]MBF6192406.1 amidohydrolase [Nocardia beijingensis]MEA3527691.1 amidohydrolase family protein [Nocardia sp. CDC192]MEB3511399.1 amidohydrolase family protein [Nocardia sp. CDC186]